MRRRRLCYGACALALIACGLLLRFYRSRLPALVGEYAPDAVWAMMVYAFCGLLLDRAPARHAACALCLCYAIEISQLYHAPWIDALRAHPLGHMVLGQGFLWSDLACYSAGVALAFGIDLLLRRHCAHKKQPA
nr:DUF2809 domain-containing protein [Maliibacterium massiliense]